MANLERVTERKGAGRTKWVWLGSHFGDVDGSVLEYENLLSSFWNGTTAVPAPQMLAGGNADYLFSAEGETQSPPISLHHSHSLTLLYLQQSRM